METNDFKRDTEQQVTDKKTVFIKGFNLTEDELEVLVKYHADQTYGVRFAVEVCGQDSTSVIARAEYARDRLEYIARVIVENKLIK